jgi:antitoxin CptB
MDAVAPELARIHWQCRRGMLELDLALGQFVDRCYGQLNAEDRACFQSILKYPDQLLFDYLFGGTTPIDKDVADVIERIRRAAAL